jgi:hypothetical protein
MVLAVSMVTTIVAFVSFGSAVVARCRLWLDNKRGFPLAFTADRLDLGGLPLEGSVPVQFKFPFSNISKQPVEIAQVVSSCGCTDVSASPRRILPGSLGVIAGTLEPSWGIQTHTLRVRLRGYELTKTLELSARFSNGVFTEETLVNLGTVRQGEAFRHVIRLKIEPWSPAWPEVAKAQQGIVQARLVKRSADAVELHITIPGTATRGRSGPIGDIIQVLGRSRSPEAPLLIVTVSGEVESSITITPPGALFGLCQPGSASQPIKITAKVPLRIVSIGHGNPRVHLRTERLSPRNWVVRVEVRSYVPGIVSDEVKLVLDNGEIYSFPVAGRFLPKG